jgi:crotonobetainyl-CoA:carnitine CoA-transferase CaiB-like acyl-CoA transferase
MSREATPDSAPTSNNAATPGGPLAGLRVIEWCDEKGTYAGKLLADAGADVVKIEVPSGDPTRNYEPFLRDEKDSERSLWFWHYNTSKRGITLDLEQERGRELFRQLVEDADVVVESQRPGRMAELGIDYDDLKAANPSMLWVAITPFGREGPRSHEEATDLTLLAVTTR